MNRDWGVIQEFKLQADTITSLTAACTIALTEHVAAAGWQVVRELDGRDALQIFWHVDKEGNKFLSPLDDPAQLAQMIWKWLREENRYAFSEEYDTDGDLKQGYEITNQNKNGWSYQMFKVLPEYIVYGK